MGGWTKAAEARFLSLQSAVFCAQCELISENNTPYCLACGSRALLNLSRVLGGSLRGQNTARVIADAELEKLVRELVQTVPPVSIPRSIPAFHSGRLRARCHSRLSPEPEIRNFDPGELHLEPAISLIAERAQVMTAATGAAVALRQGSEIICRARSGRTAPDLGVRLQTDSGLSAECVRTGEILLCGDTEANPHVDLASCRRLGVKSILVAPLRFLRRTLGVFEVLSSAPYAFDHQDVATMQLLAGMIVAAISRHAMGPTPRE